MFNSDTKLEAGVDFLTFTTNSEPIISGQIAKSKEQTTGINRYNMQRIYENGRRSLWHTKRPEMGVHTILSGKALSKMQLENSFDVFSLIKSLSARSIARMDICVDIKYGYLDFEALINDIETGNCDTKTSKYLHIDQIVNQGETIYIGSEKSETRMRIYDKQAEDNQTFQWTRIETQYRHRRAHVVTEALNASLDPHTKIPTIINRFASFPKNREWVMAMTSIKADLKTPEKTKSNRYEWLMNTAARALAAEMIADSFGVAQDFIDRVNEVYAMEKAKYR